jgi:hypothetical protein
MSVTRSWLSVTWDVDAGDSYGVRQTDARQKTAGHDTPLQAYRHQWGARLEQHKFSQLPG